MTLTTLDRRCFLKAMSTTPAAALLTQVSPVLAQEAGLITGNLCLVQPELTEGPFYIDPALVRADIVEDRPGLPLTLRLQVVSETCAPIPSARVDIWHCDAAGTYSGVEGDTGTFLRGTLHTDDQGIVEFATVFPGWYPGRVVHIHYMVFLPDQGKILTSQLFFDDAQAEMIHSDHPAYENRGAQNTSLADDRIAQSAGQGALAALSMETDYSRAIASLVIGVSSDAASPTSRFWNWMLGKS